MCKLFAPAPTRESLEELESRVSKLDEENNQLELVLQRNLEKKNSFSEKIQVETLQEIIEDYEARCQDQDAHIAEYLLEIAELKGLVEELMGKNRALRLENSDLKRKNYRLGRDFEGKCEELRKMLISGGNGSFSSCSTAEEINLGDFEEVQLGGFAPEAGKKEIFEQFQLESAKMVLSEVKRLQIEGLEGEKEEKISNFFTKSPVRALDVDSGFVRRNLGLLKMKVLAGLGVLGGLGL